MPHPRQQSLPLEVHPRFDRPEMHVRRERFRSALSEHIAKSMDGSSSEAGPACCGERSQGYVPLNRLVVLPSQQQRPPSKQELLRF